MITSGQTAGTCSAQVLGLAFGGIDHDVPLDARCLAQMAYTYWRHMFYLPL